jgi:CubicO group peptidase (beta-lactamase class C family)
MNNNEFPAGLDSRKRSLTVEHLLTMSSGFDCDEDDDKSAGYEDNMWYQTDQPDFYKWTMDLKMIREPGEKGVYCSAGANLVGGIVSKAANKVNSIWEAAQDSSSGIL